MTVEDLVDRYRLHTLPGIDRRNAGLVVSAIAHATGHADPETGKRQQTA